METIWLQFKIKNQLLLNTAKHKRIKKHYAAPVFKYIVETSAEVEKKFNGMVNEVLNKVEKVV